MPLVVRVCARRNVPAPTLLPLKKRKFDADNLLSSDGVSWYRVCLLGKGGFGSVYLANTDETHGLPYQIAVKSAPASKSFSLQYEKQVLCNLGGSPYIVRCYGAEITHTDNGDRFYNILLEYCSGLSLEHQIEKRGRLSEVVARSYTRDVVRGLKYAHDHGYAHCDIKPCNILLVPSRSSDFGFVAKIADFGLAKEIEDEWDACMPEIRGTCGYMSPELVKENRVDYPVDIWALGCSIVEMLSGESAWDYSDVDQLMQVIGDSNQVPQLPSCLCNYVSDDCKDFLSRCLARNVAERWTADMLLQHPFLAVA